MLSKITKTTDANIVRKRSFIANWYSNKIIKTTAGINKNLINMIASEKDLIKLKAKKLEIIKKIQKIIDTRNQLKLFTWNQFFSQKIKIIKKIAEKVITMSGNAGPVISKTGKIDNKKLKAFLVISIW